MTDYETVREALKHPERFYVTEDCTYDIQPVLAALESLRSRVEELEAVLRLVFEATPVWTE